MSCGVSHRCSLDPALPWLWCRPAPVAPIQPLAWGTSICRKCSPKKTKNKQTNKKKQERFGFTWLFPITIVFDHSWNYSWPRRRRSCWRRISSMNRCLGSQTGSTAKLRPASRTHCSWPRRSARVPPPLLPFPAHHFPFSIDGFIFGETPQRG